MAYKCSWCEQEREGFPVGSYTRIQDGFDLDRPVPFAYPPRFHPKYVTFSNTKLCETCMTDPVASGENFLRRYREREAAKATDNSRGGEGS